MQGCKYKDILKCDNCNHVLHRECSKFITARAKDVAQPLMPFVYSSKFKPKGAAMWSRDINRAKSLALQCAIKSNRPIRKFTLSQVVTLALNNEGVEDSVIYIECNQKTAGDVEKLKGVMVSFIEAMELNNNRFVVYVAPTVALTFDFERI